MNAPKVSIIIPVFNVENYIEKCIESCIKQTLENIEIIIVNDGSTDNSISFIEQYSKSDKRMVLINRRNEGVTLARWSGLRQSKGDYIFFLDADDYLPEDAIENMYSLGKKHEADYIMGDFIIEGKGIKPKQKRFKSFDILSGKDFISYCLLENNFYLMGRMYKRIFFLDADVKVPPEITYGEDNVAIIQLGLKLKKAVKYDGPVLHYIQRNESVTNVMQKRHIIQRDNACKFMSKFFKEKEIYNNMNFEINIFMLKELYARIVWGYVDGFFYTFLKTPFNRDKKIASNLDNQNLKIRFFLNIACINLNLSIRLYSFIRNISNRIKHARS